MKFDLGWGNSVAVRQAFVTYAQVEEESSVFDLLEMDYPSHDGDAELIEITKKVIKRQTGQEYKHILLTNGATGAVVIALRAYAKMNYQYCHTRSAPWYVRYPRMIDAAGLMHVQEDHAIWKGESVILLDIPSNPLGLTTPYPKGSVLGLPVVLDGVYLNKVYTPGNLVVPAHDVFCGSYSKLLGINGIRIGWLATNDDMLYLRLKELVASEYCGLSKPSTDLLKYALTGFHWANFERYAQSKLNNNREEWAKLERFFGTPVSELGMFYYGHTDAKCRELLAKAGIQFTSGAVLGTTEDFGRFNLGQDNRLTTQAVKAMLKADQI